MISEYALTREGLNVCHSFLIGKNFTNLPRVGVRWKFSKKYKNLTWFGKGPQETYEDRKESGIKKSTVPQLRRSTYHTSCPKSTETPQKFLWLKILTEPKRKVFG